LSHYTARRGHRQRELPAYTPQDTTKQPIVPQRIKHYQVNGNTICRNWKFAQAVCPSRFVLWQLCPFLSGIR